MLIFIVVTIVYVFVEFNASLLMQRYNLALKK